LVGRLGIDGVAVPVVPDLNRDGAVPPPPFPRLRATLAVAVVVVPSAYPSVLVVPIYEPDATRWYSAKTGLQLSDTDADVV
jgi:hypothetical protein